MKTAEELIVHMVDEFPGFLNNGHVSGVDLVEYWSQSMPYVKEITAKIPWIIRKGGVVYGHGGYRLKGVFTGGSRRCPPEACGGISYGIRWEDGKLTYKCEQQIRWDETHQAHQLK